MIVTYIDYGDRRYRISGAACPEHAARHYGGGDTILESDLAAGRIIYAVQVQERRTPTARRPESWGAPQSIHAPGVRYPSLAAAERAVEAHEAALG